MSRRVVSALGGGSGRDWSRRTDRGRGHSQRRGYSGGGEGCGRGCQPQWRPYLLADWPQLRDRVAELGMLPLVPQTGRALDRVRAETEPKVRTGPRGPGERSEKRSQSHTLVFSVAADGSEVRHEGDLKRLEPLLSGRHLGSGSPSWLCLRQRGMR